jgi:hypothetical protein
MKGLVILTQMILAEAIEWADTAQYFFYLLKVRYFTTELIREKLSFFAKICWS